MAVGRAATARITGHRVPGACPEPRAARVPSHPGDQRLVRGRKVVRIARRYLGVPYRWGGMSPSGFDCSGLVAYAYGKLGVSLPHNAAAQYGARLHRPGRAAAARRPRLLQRSRSRRALPSGRAIHPRAPVGRAGRDLVAREPHRLDRRRPPALVSYDELGAQPLVAAARLRSRIVSTEAIAEATRSCRRPRRPRSFVERP